MADRYHKISYHKPIKKLTTTSLSSLLRKLQVHVSTSTKLFGLYTLLITGAFSLLLSGLTLALAGTIIGLIIFTPLIILSSPIWVPVFIVLYLVITAFLSMCVFSVIVAVAVFSWMYRYFKGPSYSDQSRWPTHKTGFTSRQAMSDYGKEYVVY